MTTHRHEDPHEQEHGHGHGQPTAPRTIRRHTDVVVVGGSAAGLAAALQLVRQRRSVVVVDAGEPRNAPAAHLHGFLGHDGRAPGDLLATGREEVRRYGGEVLAGRATSSEVLADGTIRVALTGGHEVVARRLVVATGLVDELPPVDGLARHWGGAVAHCPFCHGYEVRDRRLVQLVSHPTALHATALLRHLSPHLTVVVAADAGVADDDLAPVSAAGVVVVHGEARRVVDAPDGTLAAVELADGRRLDADVVFVAPRCAARVEPFAGVGLRAVAHPSGMGDHLAVDELGATAVPGVYAAGNVADPMAQLVHAAAQGSRVGAAVSHDLAADDLAATDRAGGGRGSANEVDWDERYGGEQLWSGNPNGTLVAEVAGLAPGTALDVGSGEGGDAVWLAEQGWNVTATDISARALGRVAAEAGRRGLEVACRHVDATTADPFDGATFDLVSAQYASIPRAADDRPVQNLVRAVAPGGRLLVVGHDLAPMRAPIDTIQASRAFDADAYVRPEDVERAVADRPDWEVLVFETRPRPPGAASGHHVDDVVLHARRRPA